MHAFPFMILVSWMLTSGMTEPPQVNAPKPECDFLLTEVGLSLPSYPELAERARVQGKAEIKVAIQPGGEVGGIEILSGSHVLWNEQIRSAIDQWKFKPNLKGTSCTVTFSFRLFVKDAPDRFDGTRLAWPHISIGRTVKLVHSSH